MVSTSLNSAAMGVCLACSSKLDFKILLYWSRLKNYKWYKHNENYYIKYFHLQ